MVWDALTVWFQKFVTNCALVIILLQAIAPMGVKIYNELPREIRASYNFKQQVKQHFK